MQNDIFDNMNEVFFTIEKLKLDVDDKYFIYSKDADGSIKKTPTSYTLDDIEKIAF